MTNQAVPADQVALLACAREPIHIPGSIQSHGVLLAMEEPSLVIRQVSANAGELLGTPAETLLGKPLDELLEAEPLALLRSQLSHGNPADLNPLALQVGAARRACDAIIHRNDGLLILELEPADQDVPTFQGFYHLVRGAVSRLQSAATLDELCQITVEEVRRVTGFDRVMVYAFDKDWNGKVVAEERPEEMEPWLGLHYPASDIPAQARRLYTVNWLRLIADVSGQPSPLIPPLNPAAGAPLDLTYSVLRSVSPVHIEYLRNMEVGASMSISILRNNELWGLIACHHRTARHIPYVVRIAGEFLAQVLSLQVSLKEEHADYTRQLELQGRLSSLLERLAAPGSLPECVQAAAPDLPRLLDAGGAVILLDGQLTCCGETPSEEQLRSLLRWLDETYGRDTYQTDSLAEGYPEAEQIKETCSGLLTVSLVPGSRAVWLRPEVVRTVNWAGDPAKAAVVTPDGLRLHPRRSFELWKQTVRLKSAPWQAAEVRVAEQFRDALRDALYRHAEAEAKEQLESLNEKLARSNSELDWFAYIASHDLKEPLRGLQNYAKFLLEDYGATLDVEGRTKLETMVRLGTRMEALLDGLLRFSRLGRVDLALQPTDLQLVLDEAVDLLALVLQQKRVQLRVPRQLPLLRCDRARVGEVFLNLISNAIKYSDQTDRWVEVGYLDASNHEPVTLYVRDNGIGIQERYFGAIFDMFRRLHTRDKYEGGTGVGLAIVRKIVERHGGRIWVESAPGEGATFYFTLQPGSEGAAGEQASS